MTKARIDIETENWLYLSAKLPHFSILSFVTCPLVILPDSESAKVNYNMEFYTRSSFSILEFQEVIKVTLIFPGVFSILFLFTKNGNLHTPRKFRKILCLKGPETLWLKQLESGVHLVFPPLFSFHIINKEELRPKKGDWFLVNWLPIRKVAFTRFKITFFISDPWIINVNILLHY